MCVREVIIKQIKHSHLFHTEDKGNGAPPHVMKSFKGFRCTALHILNISGRRMCVVNITFLFLKLLVFSHEKPSSLVDVGTKYYYSRAMSRGQQGPPKRQHEYRHHIPEDSKLHN